MEIDNLLANFEVEANSDDLSDDNQIKIFSTLKESISFILQYWQIDNINNFVRIFSV